MSIKAELQSQVLDLKLPIIINGQEKFATGLTTKTTINDVKFAMLLALDQQFDQEMLDEYGMFEKWQDNERILDGKVKMYKIIKTWQSLPGDQLSQVQFQIKRRLKPSKVQNMLIKAKFIKEKEYLKYEFCSLSPQRDDFLPRDELECKRYSTINKINRPRKSTITKQTFQMERDHDKKLKYLNSLELELQKLANLETTDRIVLSSIGKSFATSTSSLNSIASSKCSTHIQSDSDTGISCADSREFFYPFETLV